MARKRMVTRTIIGTQAHVMTVNIKTAETGTATVMLGSKFKDEQKLFKAVSKIFEDTNPDIKAVHVISSSEVNKCFGMDEAEFLKLATELDPETRKALEAEAEQGVDPEPTNDDTTSKAKNKK